MPRDQRAPSFQFYPADWLSDPAVDALSFDEQGRYFRALCMTRMARTPGRAPEGQWREWMRYTADEWPEHRDRLSRCFRVQPDGIWTQKRTLLDYREQRRRFLSAKEAGRLSGVARRARAVNGFGTETRTGGERIGNETPTPSSSSSSSPSIEETQHTCPPSANGHNPKAEWTEGFDVSFWPGYPRKVARKAALKAWLTVKPWSQERLDEVCAGLDRWRTYWTDHDTPADKIPHPATWLHQERWESVG